MILKVYFAQAAERKSSMLSDFNTYGDLCPQVPEEDQTLTPPPEPAASYGTMQNVVMSHRLQTTALREIYLRASISQSSMILKKGCARTSSTVLVVLNDSQA